MHDLTAKELVFNGTQVSYSVICDRKLWLFTHNVKMEQQSELVKLGRLLHEHSYRGARGVMLDSIAIDFIREGDQLVVHEVKKSRKLEKAHEIQLAYYLYCLKEKGVEAVGRIDYPKLRKTLNVELTAEREAEIAGILRSIPEVINSVKPPKAVKKPYCRRCSYFEFCFI